MAERFAREDKLVGILAVDPSSELSGGALLGDRVRMTNLDCGDRIFLRSISSRGCLGGVSRTTEDIVRVMDAAGRDIIIIETIGVGQDECDVTHIAESSVLVLAPGLGDEIQFMKAGITEMADVFVVNKSDQPGSKRYFRALNQYNDWSASEKAWIPPIIETDALHNKGLDILHAAIKEHLAFVKAENGFAARRKERLSKEITKHAENAVASKLKDFLKNECVIDSVITDIINGDTDPYSGADSLVKRFFLSQR
jgi:LAO/AO transport system kinase